eukprot:6492709-Amphidinium_carterae.5
MHPACNNDVHSFSLATPTVKLNLVRQPRKNTSGSNAFRTMSVLKNGGQTAQHVEQTCRVMMMHKSLLQLQFSGGNQHVCCNKESWEAEKVSTPASGCSIWRPFYQKSANE